MKIHFATSAVLSCILLFCDVAGRAHLSCVQIWLSNRVYFSYVLTRYNSSAAFSCQVPVLKFHPEEVTIWSLLDQNNVVRLFGVLRLGETIYFLQQFVDGETLLHLFVFLVCPQGLPLVVRCVKQI